MEEKYCNIEDFFNKTDDHQTEAQRFNVQNFLDAQSSSNLSDDAHEARRRTDNEESLDDLVSQLKKEKRAQLTWEHIKKEKHGHIEIQSEKQKESNQKFREFIEEENKQLQQQRNLNKQKTEFRCCF